MLDGCSLVLSRSGCNSSSLRATWVPCRQNATTSTALATFVERLPPPSSRITRSPLLTSSVAPPGVHPEEVDVSVDVSTSGVSWGTAVETSMSICHDF